MELKITFINPNSEDVVDKYLPKILAEAIISKLEREECRTAPQHDCKVQPSA